MCIFSDSYVYSMLLLKCLHTCPNLLLRFIVAGPIGGYISGNSVGVFQYDLAYSLSQEITEDISDHYPIECLIQGKQNFIFLHFSSVYLTSVFYLYSIF